MNLKERTRLKKEHEEARAAFDATRSAVQARIGVCTRDEFASLSRAVDKAWDVLHSTRFALDEHIRQHAS